MTGIFRSIALDSPLTDTLKGIGGSGPRAPSRAEAAGESETERLERRRRQRAGGRGSTILSQEQSGAGLLSGG